MFTFAPSKENKGMKATDPNDPFYTSEMVEYMRAKNLENISYEEHIEVLQAIIDVYAPKPGIHFNWSDPTILHEAEAVYSTRKELKAKRQEAAKKVAEDDNVCTLNQVFTILSYRDMGFKEEYLEHETLAKRNCPMCLDELRQNYFVTGYYPGRDQGPQTDEEWEELLAEDNSDNWIEGEEVWSRFRTILS